MQIWGYTFSEEKIANFVLLYGAHVLAAVAILVIGILVAKCIRRLAEKIMRRAKLESILVNFLSKIIYALLVTFVIIAALNKLGVQTASLIAVLGAAGLAIGLALQGSLSNFAAGIMIIILKHFKLGDTISTPQVSGTVEDMNIFTTTLKTATNEKIIVPNNMLTSNVLTNTSAYRERRIDLLLNLDHRNDLEEVAKVLNGIINSEKRIVKKPEPYVGVENLTETGVAFAVRVWVKAADMGDAKSDFLQAILDAFDKKDIRFSSAQRLMELRVDEEKRQLLKPVKKEK